MTVPCSACEGMVGKVMFKPRAAGGETGEARDRGEVGALSFVGEG